MNTTFRNILIAATLVVSGAVAFGGCYVSPAPTSSVGVHASTVPTRVYYEGRYLYYRTDGYYYYNSGAWRPARAVPTHVSRYHRPNYRPTAYRPPARPTHVSRGYDRSPTYYRPPASRRPTARPPASRRPTARPPASGRPSARPPASRRPTARPPASRRPTARPPASSRPSARPSGGTVRTPHGARPTTGRSVYRR